MPALSNPRARDVAEEDEMEEEEDVARGRWRLVEVYEEEGLEDVRKGWRHLV